MFAWYRLMIQNIMLQECTALVTMTSFVMDQSLLWLHGQTGETTVCLNPKNKKYFYAVWFQGMEKRNWQCFQKSAPG